MPVHELLCFLVRGGLLIAGGTALALLMSRAPAARRSTLWTISLTGTLLIPVVSPLLPQWRLPAPPAVFGGVRMLASRDDASSAARAQRVPMAAQPAVADPTSQPPEAFGDHDRPTVSARGWQDSLALVWAGGMGLLVFWQLLGLWRLRRLARTMRPIREPRLQSILERARRRVGVTRKVKLALSDQVSVPVTWGLVEPCIVLPPGALRWLPEKIEMALLHELVHVRELHWPLRLVAHLACALSWCNPLAWWARRRLTLEQELSCDEVLLDLGERASTYAGHLLELARATPRNIIADPAALRFCRRSQLEERIMAILDSRKKLGVAWTLPVLVLTALLIPAVAAVQPWNQGSEPENTDLKSIVHEIQRVEEEMRPVVDRFAEVEAEMAPALAQIEELEFDAEASAEAIERALAPMQEAFAALELEMGPIHVEMEELELQLEPYLESISKVAEAIELKADDLTRLSRTGITGDGTLAGQLAELHEALAPLHEQMRSIEVDMAPLHEKLAQLQIQLEPYHERLAALQQEHFELQRDELERVRESMEPSLDELARIQEHMAPHHQRLSELEREMAPFSERLERLGRRLEAALQQEIAGRLQSQLGPVLDDNAPFTEAAARIVDEASITVEGDRVRLTSSKQEMKQILDDLFSPHQRAGRSIDYAQALDRAVASITQIELE